VEAALVFAQSEWHRLLQSVVSRVASFHEGQDRKRKEGKKENTNQEEERERERQTDRQTDGRTDRCTKAKVDI
jgi:hypothetical protein